MGVDVLCPWLCLSVGLDSARVSGLAIVSSPSSLTMETPRPGRGSGGREMHKKRERKERKDRKEKEEERKHGAAVKSTSGAPPTALLPPVAHDGEHAVDAVESMDASSAVSAIVEAYRDVARDNVEGQITTWNNIVGLASDQYYVDAAGRVPIRSSARSLAKESPQTKATVDDDIIWDHESDIPTYFQGLMSRCSVSNFTYHGCFGYLHSLAADPRCTTSLDSRYTCNGGERREASRSAGDVIRNHLTNDTVNVIVIGAGPVGLLLANALSHPGGVRPPGAQGGVRTRVLVFENRVVKSGLEGRKRPYTRDWPTELRNRYFTAGGAVDPRIRRFFQLIFEGNFVLFPVYIIETLLLLSCRDRSVRFVYGDYGDYADALTGVRNAIVFDATWAPAGPGRPAGWSRKKFTEFIVGRNASVLVVKRESAAGLVKYPINRANGHPFQIHYLKMYRLWSGVDDEAFRRVWDSQGGNTQVWNESFNTEENLLCRDACNVTACDVRKWNSISMMCSVARWYDWGRMMDRPRKDIMAALRQISLEDALFSTSVSFLSLLPGQANAFADLYEGPTGGRDAAHRHQHRGDGGGPCLPDEQHRKVAKTG
ncbi:hypothetical protein THAOC_05039 [Thalassiosira oceanica]|uniref:Uncharacterized protein n=1 Tax=Thalassiosira oceanica TaxID=159749 RepID=K0TNA6_THAOC|nr:hypothetical protein THAOC_05039 [Thalassiosira oceanica]|eukprot:EJK73342.1 hypothetical protein THAOC_05039 [Thalassiosira oceanica]